LITNGWELLLKATLAKGGKGIHYPKRRNEPYRTLTWQDTANRIRNEGLWPAGVDYDATRENIRAIADFRDSAVHLYNVKGFPALVHALAQQSVVNFKDILYLEFGRDLTTEITWHLMPLGSAVPDEPIEFLAKRTSPTGAPRRDPVASYLGRLRESLDKLQQDGADVSRVATTYAVTLQSVKKLQAADIVVGVDGTGSADKVFIKQTSDPNKDYPYNMTRLLTVVNGKRSGRRMNNYDFQAVVFKFNMRQNDRLCWIHGNTNVPQWSNDAVAAFCRLNDDDLALARKALGKRTLQQRK
jgi:hypothetical protein